MVVAARGGRSGVTECIRSCLALLLPSLSVLLLPSFPLSHLSLFCFLSQKNILIVSWRFTFFKLFVQICCNLPFIFVLKIDCLFFVQNHGFPRSQWYGNQYVFFEKQWFYQCLARSPMINLAAADLSIVYTFLHFGVKRWKTWKHFISALYSLYNILVPSDKKCRSIRSQHCLHFSYF